ncbi:MAG: hypothetical protein LV480_12360 [Methylacidiphilales bacterium]|nr:hypothetical protein [Candidatus Methylacidiphilales bacterium]
MTTRQLIEEAFADVPYPGDDNIADHQDCLECDDIRAFFRGRSWRELKFPELRSFPLPLLTPDAFHYFLPGYMLACLDDWKMADTIPCGVMTIGGYRNDASTVKKEAREKRKKFTPSQREAIAAWLRELGKNGPLELRDDEDVEYAATQIIED